MSPTAKKLATYEDLYKIPENTIGEIIAGELHVSPRPAPKHSKVSSTLGMRVGSPFQFGESGGPGGWIILDEPELHLEGQVFVSDLASWKKERLSAAPEGNGITVVPNWICEILSPSTLRLDRVIKMPLYGSFGVSHLWLIDPIAKTLEVFKLENSKWTLLGSYADDAKVRAEPFEVIELSLKELWWE